MVDAMLSIDDNFDYPDFNAAPAKGKGKGKK